MSLFPPLKPAAARAPCLIGSTGRRRLAGPLAVLVLCCLAVFSAAGATGAETLDEGGAALAAVVLDIRSHPGDKTDWQALGRSLVRLKAGDRLTAASLDAALAALAACTHRRSCARLHHQAPVVQQPDQLPGVGRGLGPDMVVEKISPRRARPAMAAMRTSIHSASCAAP